MLKMCMSLYVFVYLYVKKKRINGRQSKYVRKVNMTVRVSRDGNSLPVFGHIKRYFSFCMNIQPCEMKMHL